MSYARLALLDLRRLAPLLLDETSPVVVGDDEEDDDEDDEDDDDEEDDEEGAVSSTTIGLSTVPPLPFEKERWSCGKTKSADCNHSQQ